MNVLHPINANPTAKLQYVQRYNTKLCISTQYADVIINKTDILYLKASSNYCEIHLVDGTSQFCSKTLKEISNRIQNPDFIKVHRSFVINSNGLESIDSTYKTLKLTNNIEIPISRAQKANLKAFIKLRFD